MSKKIHEPGQPLKQQKRPSVKKVKIHKAHKDWFGARNDVEHSAK
jgi:hypothetical protein